MLITMRKTFRPTDRPLLHPIDFHRTEAKPAMQQTAEWVASKLESIGIENIKIMPTAGHPVVYGDHLHAGPDALTVLVYGHYDVQPADPLELWDTPPFEPTLKTASCMPAVPLI